MDEPVCIDAGAVIARMREVLGVATDLALCAALNRGSSVVASWRHRNSVPYEDCAELALRKGVSLDWLVLGRGPGSGAAAADPGAPATTADADPRVARMLAFIRAWPTGREGDDVAWLERTLARNVQEYGQWLASQTTPSSRSTGDRQDDPGQ